MTAAKLKTNPRGKTIMVPATPSIIKPRVWTEEDFDLIEEYYAMESRESLWAFRQYMNPNLIKGRFPEEVSNQLQLFYDRLINGERPKLLIEAPPQHGKSNGLQDFMAWLAGKAPRYKQIYASFSEDLGQATNMYIQRMISNREKYGRVFPDTMMSATNIVTTAVGDGKFARNSSFIEWVGQHGGSFRNVTVQGQVSGKSLDVGVIDDPLKGREAAQSPTIRNKTWLWLMDEFFNRFSEYAGLIITMTRWHVDDPAGRFLAEFPDTVVIKFPALSLAPTKKLQAERPYEWRTEKDLPLFPEFKSKEFLLLRKKAYTQASWESLYQQSPIVAGGGMFPIEMVKYARNMPGADDVKKSVRYWDKAGTEGGTGAETAGVLMHTLNDGRWFISDVRHGTWNAWDREKIIKATAGADEQQWGTVDTWIEQEPGSGGKESAERTIQNLAGFRVQADKVTGSKEVRAEPYAAQWQGGNIIMHVNKRWNSLFVDEHETFPQGRIDMVDAAAGAFAKLITRKYKYDTSLAWVG
jgi:predicted phage terminase large subunit-like protein